VVEHGGHQCVLAAEVPVDQAVVDARARGDVADRRRSQTALSEQVGRRSNNGRDNLVPADWAVGAS
jgi:hypothetical protein